MRLMLADAQRDAGQASAAVRLLEGAPADQHSGPNWLIVLAKAQSVADHAQAAHQTAQQLVAPIALRRRKLKKRLPLAV